MTRTPAMPSCSVDSVVADAVADVEVGLVRVALELDADATHDDGTAHQADEQ